MLYQLYETQRALMAPFAEFASASSKLYNHPLSPFAQLPMAQRMSAGFDLLHRLAKEYEKPAFGITAVESCGIEVAVQEQVALHKPFCRLLRFKRFSDDARTLNAMKSHPTVLVVAPLSGHHSTLLRETVRSLLQDHKVFITDWSDARMVPASVGPFHLDDYVAYVQEFIRHIANNQAREAAATGDARSPLHVISVCQPTVPVLAAVSLMASRGEPTPKTMTMMGGPIDARKSPTAVNNLAMNKSHGWFENNVIFRVPTNFPGAGRRVYPGFLQHTGFVAMNPDRHLSSHYDYFLDLVRGDDADAESHREFYDEYNAVLDMPAEYYLDTIKTVFQDFALVNGSWVVGNEPVRPQDIRSTSLLTIEGELDDISGAGQTRAAHELCSGIPAERHFHYDVKGAGHYGIFSGRRWREMVYPEVKAFIARYDAAEAPKAAARRKPRRR
jgi:poly(3-hydroxybutyrate) depolymerase